MTTETPPPLPYGPAVYMERERRGWTRQDLSDRLSQVGVTSVWRLETGKSLPTVRTLEAFARALGMETSELVRLAEDFRDKGPVPVIRPENRTAQLAELAEARSSETAVSE